MIINLWQDSSFITAKYYIIDIYIHNVSKVWSPFLSIYSYLTNLSPKIGRINNKMNSIHIRFDQNRFEIQSDNNLSHFKELISKCCSVEKFRIFYFPRPNTNEKIELTNQQEFIIAKNFVTSNNTYFLIERWEPHILSSYLDGFSLVESSNSLQSSNYSMVDDNKTILEPKRSPNLYATKSIVNEKLIRDSCKQGNFPPPPSILVNNPETRHFEQESALKTSVRKNPEEYNPNYGQNYINSVAENKVPLYESIVLESIQPSHYQSNRFGTYEPKLEESLKESIVIQRIQPKYSNEKEKKSYLKDVDPYRSSNFRCNKEPAYEEPLLLEPTELNSSISCRDLRKSVNNRANFNKPNLENQMILPRGKIEEAVEEDKQNNCLEYLKPYQGPKLIDTQEKSRESFIEVPKVIYSPYVEEKKITRILDPQSAAKMIENSYLVQERKVKNSASIDSINSNIRSNESIGKKRVKCVREKSENAHIDVYEDLYREEIKEKKPIFRSLYHKSTLGIQHISQISITPIQNSNSPNYECSQTANRSITPSCYFCRKPFTGNFYKSCPVCPYFSLCTNCQKMEVHHPHHLSDLPDLNFTEQLFLEISQKLSHLGFTNNEKIAHAIHSSHYNFSKAASLLLD